MNNQIRNDEYRQGYKEPNVRLDIVQEGDFDRSTEGLTTEGGQEQKRQPSE
jgi:hypothetical protein